MEPLAARPVVRGHWHPLPSRPMSAPTADPSMCRMCLARSISMGQDLAGTVEAVGVRVDEGIEACDGRRLLRPSPAVCEC